MFTKFFILEGTCINFLLLYQGECLLNIGLVHTDLFVADMVLALNFKMSSLKGCSSSNWMA